MNFEKIKEEFYYNELVRNYLNLKVDIVLYNEHRDDAKIDDQILRLLESYVNAVLSLGRFKSEELMSSAIRYSYIDDKENDFSDLSDVKNTDNNLE